MHGTRRSRKMDDGEILSVPRPRRLNSPHTQVERNETNGLLGCNGLSGLINRDWCLSKVEVIKISVICDCQYRWSNSA